MKYYCQLIAEEDGYFVEFPDLPNVFTEGSTVEESIQNAYEALNGVLEVDVAHGQLPEEPVTRGSNLYPIEVATHIDIAIQLRKLRGKNSQDTIASKLGLTYQAYQRLENPLKSNPTVKTLEKLAKAMGEPLSIRIGSPTV